MAAKLKVESLVAVEVKKFEDKLNQFQQYLELNTIVTKVTQDSQVLLAEEQQDKLHKEILVQIKMQDAILNWLPLLKTLKENEEKVITARGGAEINGLFKKRRTTTENNNE